MILLTEFTVLIEKRRVRDRLVGMFVAVAMVAGALCCARLASAQPILNGKHDKIARDLQDGLSTVSPRNRSANGNWARDVNGVRTVQVVIVTDGSDADMSDLRAEVLRLGGSVHARHPAVRALTVQVPAQHVGTLAQRKDVVSVSPNRATRRTASTLESISGALTANVRSSSSKTTYSGLDGTGIGIAVLDSGVMKAHEAFLDGAGSTRVLRNVNILNGNLSTWLNGVDATVSPAPGSTALANYESSIAYDSASTQDSYGHGTHVASVAAGRAKYYTYAGDTTGIAPNATIYDVKVLGSQGIGSLSDALEGIQWVIYHAREYNIRVLNVSLATDSTETWQTDPLCAAVRSATAAGITVVVAAGNFGKDDKGREIYGSVSAPGNDPSVITIGAVNYKNTTSRSDDSVNFFSSRGPTRSSYVDSYGTRRVDNVLKPDLVAPGNKIIGAAATKASYSYPTWNYLATNYYNNLVTPVGIYQAYGETQMMLSGTSIAAPVVSGAAALLLQANPGLTPPLVKAILQYTAQPLPGANLLQQGAGLLNIDGAIALAKTLRTDIASKIEAGTMPAGTALLASGKTSPAQISKINGADVTWSRIVFAGGTHVVSGTALFTKFQPIYDPRITWAGKVVRKRQVVYWSGTGIAANTYAKSFTDAASANTTLLTSAVVQADLLAGASSVLGKTGVFIPTPTLSAWLISGSGLILSEGMILSEGLVLSEGLLLSETGADANDPSLVGEP